jgi:hypothetical protein
MRPLRTWFDGTARAIADDPALRPYAVLLSFAHALTGVAWFTYKHVSSLASGEDCVCWPLVPDCYRLRPHLTPEIVRAAVVAYIAIGTAAAALFAIGRARSALATFIVAAIAGTLLYSLDYRLRLNQTYMFGWVVLVFLFAPRKALVLQTLVALFYFWAGTLKLNAEWVTGAALYAKPFLVPAALVPASCVYVLVLEMVFVWGLFSERRGVRVLVYAQLLVFHAVSWSVVGYFYPLVMFALTAIYPLVWLFAPEQALTLRALHAGGTSARSAVGGIAALFSAFQLVPYLFPGDTALTGEGRLFALHMFDAQSQCEGGAILTTPSGRRSRATLINDRIDPRSHCDPIALVAQAQRLCRLLAERDGPGAPRVDVAIDVKRTTDAQMQPLIHVDDFCRQRIAYSVWRHNAWIGK